MSQFAPEDFPAIYHPLAGLESWPATGPIYGFADERDSARPVTLWERISERLRKPPRGESFNAGQARIWY